MTHSPFDRWMRNVERRLLHLERRYVPSAADVVGPGLGMAAAQVMDWNDEATGYCGFFFSSPGAVNAPDAPSWWIGYVLVDDSGNGVQRLVSYHGTGPLTKFRTFTTTAGAVRAFGAWTTDP